jgi:phosphoribosylamine--glycine ligase
LQEKIDGVEIGIARYFNGNDWVGPVEFNIEHKSLFPNDIGPKTGEMGTVMWYENDEDVKLFKKTLAKLNPYLRRINFKGDIDINFIINKKGVFPLEFTARFGSPSTQLQTELHLSPWKEFLLAVARGKKYQLKYKKSFGVVVSVSIPPFPYKAIHHDYYEYYSKGAEILFRKKLSKEEMNQIHFEEVSFNPKTGNYYISGSNGFILYVTGSGKTVEDARKSAYTLIGKLVIPKMFYRTDIGEKFIREDQKKLKEWGWI